MQDGTPTEERKVDTGQTLRAANAPSVTSSILSQIIKGRNVNIDQIQITTTFPSVKSSIASENFGISRNLSCPENTPKALLSTNRAGELSPSTIASAIPGAYLKASNALDENNQVLQQLLSSLQRMGCMWPMLETIAACWFHIPITAQLTYPT